MGCAVRSPSGWGSARGDAVRRAHRILRGHGAAVGWAALCEAHRGGDRREEMRFAELTASYGGTERPWDGLRCAKHIGVGSPWGDAVRRAHRILRVARSGRGMGCAVRSPSGRGRRGAMRFAELTASYGGAERPWDGLSRAKPIGAGSPWDDAVRRAHRILRGHGATVGWAEPCEVHRGGIAVGRCGSPSSPHPAGARSGRGMG